MGCTPEAVVCDDTGTSTDVGMVLVVWGVGIGVVVLVVLLGVALVRRRQRRPRRGPVVRVWVSADGEVVRRAWLPAANSSPRGRAPAAVAPVRFATDGAFPEKSFCTAAFGIRTVGGGV